MTRFFNPLCGYPLRRGAIWIAAIDLVIYFSLVSVRLYTLDFNASQNLMQETIDKLDLHKLGNITHQAIVEEILKDLATSHYINRVIAISSMEMLFVVLEAWLCRLLIRSSKRGNVSGLKWWMIIRSTLTLLGMITFGLGIYVSVEMDLLDWTLELITVYRIFEIVVINELRKEVIATGPAERF